MNETSTNAHEYSVSELAFSLKRTVEETYGRVRVRGELGRVTIAKSGHMYADVKDDKAVISGVMWKGNVGRLSVRPEEGMEVVVEGKLSTYPGRSQYQLIMDKLEPAGVGALMALLEKRKKTFAAEGLFSADRKVELPYLPKTIGVVTSPTGAVIRDIIHRISDRFPVRVLVWPVLVQGDKAAAQISAAITGFNHMDDTAELPRPDLIIVARGGGSIEDLWCFNEENVVRAAAGSKIPLISAVGHETDWTLIDYVADERAPTPTGAAEIAVPVRAELIDTVDDYALRLRRGLTRTVESKKMGFAAARLPKLENVLSTPRQRLDLVSGRLLPSLMRTIESKKTGLTVARLPKLANVMAGSRQRLGLVSNRLLPAFDVTRRAHISALRELSARLRPDTLKRDVMQRGEKVQNAAREVGFAMKRVVERAQNRVESSGKLLGAYSYQGVLARGYALVTDGDGRVVRKGKPLKSGQAVKLTFTDGHRDAVIDGSAKKPAKHPKKPSKISADSEQKKQGDLF